MPPLTPVEQAEEHYEFHMYAAQNALSQTANFLDEVQIATYLVQIATAHAAIATAAATYINARKR